MGTVNLSLPKITMEELEDDAKLQKILSYLYQLNEQLRYELTHIDDDNISGDGISEVSLTDSVSRTLKNDQGEVLQLYMNARRMILELTGKVDESTDDLAAISERMAKVEINSERIETEVSYIQEAQDATDAEIKTINEKVTSFEQTAEGFAADLSDVKTEVNSLDGSVTTLEEHVAEVDLTAKNLQIEFSEISIGDRNLLLNSGTDVTSADYNVAWYEPSSPLEAGKEYTLVMSVTPAEGVTSFAAYLSYGNSRQGGVDAVGTEKQLLSFTFVAEYREGMEPSVSAGYANLYIYRFPNDGTVTGETTIHWIKVVEGNKATNNYTFPPEEDEFHNTAVDINAQGMEINTTGSIRAIVDDVERLTIDETGVNAPLIMADEVHAGNIVEMHMSATAEWKGGIQKSLDALPKYLMQDTTLTVPAGTYAEDVVIKGFVGSKLTILLSAGVTINGTVTMSNCVDVALLSNYLGNAFIYPRSAGYTVIGIYNCQAALLQGLYISGYRGRTASVAGSTIGVEVYCSNMRIYYACIEYTSSYAYYQDRGTFYMENVIGGSEGSDAATNANLGWGVRAFKGAHGAIYGRCPLSVSGNGASVATLLTTSAAPTAGGMTYTEPEYVTQSFPISKHCTYLYGVKRIRDDQATTFSQGYYGAYTAGNNNWRIGAMWFASAASALAGKTIRSAKLTMRRASGGWSNAVPVYLGTVELAESGFTSTLTPTFAKASAYPIANLARETEATYDVTSLISAIQAGQAIGVFEPRGSFSGNFSPAYTNFYGLGSGYEPVLTVEYK